jgi:S1-C subfamily serine protease
MPRYRTALQRTPWRAGLSLPVCTSPHATNQIETGQSMTKTSGRVLLLGPLLAFCLVLSPITGRPQAQNRERSVADVVKSTADAVVLVVTSDESGKALKQGSGFIISADGKVLTNDHVIAGARSAMVKLSNGAFFPVDGLLASNQEHDLALIKVAGTNLPTLSLGDVEKLAVGDRVIAVGTPLGLENTVSDGIISAIREIGGLKWIQTTAPVSHGNSGGPLVNLEGKAVGVVTSFMIGGENLKTWREAKRFQRCRSAAAQVVSYAVGHRQVPV